MEMQTEILQMPKVVVPAEVLVVGAVPPCWECALRSARRAGEEIALFFPLYFVSRKKKKTQSGKLCQAGLEQRLGTELIIVMLMSC